jgi:hypothetical protein
MTRRTKWLLTLTALLAVYVGCYLGLSRRGFEEADRYNMKGFYYVPLENSDAWHRKQRIYRFVFAPANAVDRALGTGRPVGCEPLWGLSR